MAKSTSHLDVKLISETHLGGVPSCLKILKLFLADVFIANLLAVNYIKLSGCSNLYDIFLDKPGSGDTGGREE